MSPASPAKSNVAAIVLFAFVGVTYSSGKAHADGDNENVTFDSEMGDHANYWWFDPIDPS